MTDDISSVVVGTSALAVAAFFALFLALTRDAIKADSEAGGRVVRVASIAIVLQVLHFAEEFLTGFYIRFPELLGLSPWPITFFVVFNVFWIAVWIFSVVGLQALSKVAAFALWFLGIACLMNVVAHPALAIIDGGYFPGLWTAPLVGIVGVALLRGLSAATRKPRP